MATRFLDRLLETGLLPDPVIRFGIRHLLAKTIQRECLPSREVQQARLQQFIAELKQAPIAIETDAANEQHYELPPQFFDTVLGPRRKYSSGLYLSPKDSLAQAEENMLALYVKRAQIQPGQTILDLGCGWGSLSLYLAEQFPDCQITGFSNSRPQKAFIDSQAQARGLTNLTIQTGNIVTEDLPHNTFDRILSIEMFEHMKNYQRLLKKVSQWMKPDAMLFIHIFTHWQAAYHYEDSDGTDWLARYFFTGGTMPSHDLLLHFQEDVILQDQWAVCGTHYEKTSNHWLENMDRSRQLLWPLFEETYGAEAQKWWQYWRIFFMACAELWGYRDGNEWLVSHYLFSKRAA